MSAPLSSTQLMTVPEVADFLRRSPAQIRWMRQQGTGPRSAKIAGRIMYRRDEVEAWVELQFEQDQVSAGTV